MTRLVRVVLGIALSSGACTSDVELGTYRVTKATAEQDARPLELGDMPTFVVMRSPHGVSVTASLSRNASDSMFDPDLDDVPTSDDGYAIDQLDATLYPCEVFGGGQQCVYSYTLEKVSAPSSGSVHVEECVASQASGCSQNAACGDPHEVLALCRVPRVIDGELVN